MTALNVTGFEHGLASLNGGGLFDSFLSNSTIITSPVRNGTYALRINAGATTPGEARLGVFTSRTDVSVRFAFRFASLPSGRRTIFFVSNDVGNDIMMTYSTSTGRVGLWVATSLGGGFWVDESWSPAISAGVWYVLDVKVVISGGVGTVDGNFKADGDASFTSLTQRSSANWDGTVSQVSPGTWEQSPGTIDCAFDDVLCATGVDWPLGDGKVIGILPGSDGAHNAGTTIFIGSDTATTPNFTNSTTTAWQLVDDTPPWTTTRSTTDNVSQEVTGTANYLEIAPAPTPETGTANAVRALLAYSSSTTTANQGKAEVRNGAGVASELWGIFPATVRDYSETSNFFKRAIVTEPAGGWIPSAVDAVRWRIGGSGDISPRPTWQALLLEVDYPVVVVTASPVKHLAALGVG